MRIKASCSVFCCLVLVIAFKAVKDAYRALFIYCFKLHFYIMFTIFYRNSAFWVLTI